MNCDEAFELMTHPTDHTSEDLLWHLQLCPRCQQMKETLAPALEPFQQFLGDLTESDELNQFFSDVRETNEGDSSPAFQQTREPFLSEESVRIAEQAATRLRTEVGVSQSTEQTSKVNTYQKRLLHAALVLIAGFLMGWGISLGGSAENHLSAGANSIQSQQQCLWVTQSENTATQLDKLNYDQASVNSVVLSCVACHLSSTAK